MVAALAVLGWALAAVLCVVVWQLERRLGTTQVASPESPEFSDEPVVEADGPPAGSIPLHDFEFRLVQTTSDARRARLMLERGSPGPNETLELYDGPHLRGSKQGPTLRTV